MPAWSQEPMPSPNAVFSPLRYSASPLLELPSIAACLWVSLHSVFFAVSEKHGLLGLGQVNWLPIKEYAFICLEKLLSAFRSWLWVIINLHSELLSNQFCSISLNRENSLVNAKIHPAASISCHIINKYVDPILLTTMHPHCLHIACTMFDRWCGAVIQVISCFSPFNTFLFPSI